MPRLDTISIANTAAHRKPIPSTKDAIRNLAERQIDSLFFRLSIAACGRCVKSRPIAQIPMPPIPLRP